jgi:hypothetical protein
LEELEFLLSLEVLHVVIHILDIGGGPVYDLVEVEKDEHRYGPLSAQDVPHAPLEGLRKVLRLETIIH